MSVANALTTDIKRNEIVAEIQARRDLAQPLVDHAGRLLEYFGHYRDLVESTNFDRKLVSVSAKTKVDDFPSMMSVIGFRAYLGIGSNVWNSWKSDESAMRDACLDIESSIHAQALELAAQGVVPFNLVMRMIGPEMADHQRVDTNANVMTAKKKDLFRQFNRGMYAHMLEDIRKKESGDDSDS